MKLNDLTAQMTPGISDLHLIVGELPEHLQTRFVLDRHAVVSTVRHDLRRFRLSAFWEKGQPCATLRAIPGEVPRLTTLRIAPEPLEVLVKLTKYTRGLVIVT